MLCFEGYLETFPLRRLPVNDRHSPPMCSRVHSEAAMKVGPGATLRALGLLWKHNDIMLPLGLPCISHIAAAQERGSLTTQSRILGLSRWRQNLLGLGANWWQGARPPGTWNSLESLAKGRLARLGLPCLPSTQRKFQPHFPLPPQS